MYSVEKLYRPSSVEEALDILDKDPGTLPLAGGTDVIVTMRKKRPKNVKLLSLAGIEQLKGVFKMADGTVSIGPMTSFTGIAGDPIIQQKYPMLATAALSMGGPQIQNVATIGGNVCNGAVSADSAPSLFALDARIVLQSVSSERIVAIEDFYLGPGKVAKEKNELMTRILIPPHESFFGGTYIKFSTRKAMDLAILGTAATCTIDEKQKICKVTIALGVAAPTPIRCPKAEAFLTGKLLDRDMLEEAGRLAVLEASPRDSWRASKRYRTGLIQELTGRALEEAYRRAGGRIYDTDSVDIK